MGVTVIDRQTQQSKPLNLQDALTYLNEFLAYDGYELCRMEGATVSSTRRAEREENTVNSPRACRKMLGQVACQQMV